MAAEVPLGVVLDHDLAFVGLAQRDGALERADERMVRLHATVEYANPDPGTG